MTKNILRTYLKTYKLGCSNTINTERNGAGRWVCQRTNTRPCRGRPSPKASGGKGTTRRPARRCPPLAGTAALNDVTRKRAPKRRPRSIRAPARPRSVRPCCWSATACSASPSSITKTRLAPARRRSLFDRPALPTFRASWRGSQTAMPNAAASGLATRPLPANCRRP